MRAKNNREIRKGYLKFAFYLAACVMVAVLVFYSYIRTSTVEVIRIMAKTQEYDKIYIEQTELAGRIDTLYQYVSYFNTNLNDVLLQSRVSRRKQEINSSMEQMSGRDIRLYQKLMSEVNTFLAAKDSIRSLRQEEELLRKDLKKCMEDNKQANRRVTLGGIRVNQ